AFTPARMRSGVSLVVDATRLRELARGADLCITGEGGIDAQTRFGKTPFGVARAVKETVPGCPVVALAGCVGQGCDELLGEGIDAIYGILPGPCTLAQAIGDATANLRRTARSVAAMAAACAGQKAGD
ncbi:MAG: glycerate kinase, partial [Bifidobacterium sp.]|nr:glycerate kinase [Bifidobacterium sp.]